MVVAIIVAVIIVIVEVTVAEPSLCHKQDAPHNPGIRKLNSRREEKNLKCSFAEGYTRYLNQIRVFLF